MVAAPRRRSAFHARNAGAAVAPGQWLLFTDADCVPPRRPARPAARSRSRRGLRRGRRRGARRASQRALARPLGAVAAWARSPRTTSTLGPRRLGRPPTCSCGATRSRPSAGSARCARTPTSSSAGGIQERGLGLRVPARGVVAHRDPERLVAVVRQAAGYGAGRRWLRSVVRRGACPAMPLARPLAPGCWPGRSRGRWRCGSSAPRSSSSTASSPRPAWSGYRLGDNRPTRHRVRPLEHRGAGAHGGPGDRGDLDQVVQDEVRARAAARRPRPSPRAQTSRR